MLFTNDKRMLVPMTFTLSSGTASFPALVAGEQGRGRRLIVLPINKMVSLTKVEDGYSTGYRPLDGSKVSIGKTSTGRPAVINDDGKRYVLASSHAAYTRRGNGYTEMLDGSTKVLASGNGADGDAGRIGTWGVDLYEIESPEGIIKCRMSGDTEGEYIIWNDNDFVTVSESEVELYFGQKNEAVPACLIPKKKDISDDDDISI